MNMNSLPVPQQGELWVIDFNPTQGAEMGKIRPAVVISNGAYGKLPLIIVAPITDWKLRYDSYPWFTKLEVDKRNGLVKDSGVDAFQVRSISVLRCKKKLGSLTSLQLKEVVQSLLFCIDVS
jgi:mRNA interferase MazF